MRGSMGGFGEASFEDVTLPSWLPAASPADP
jgi:hypothetical protein